MINYKRRRILFGLGTVLALLFLLALLLRSMNFFDRAAYPVRYEEQVTRYAEEYGLSPALVYAVIRTESSFQPDAKSHAGAMGLMQITEPTFFFICEKGRFKEYVTEDLYDPEVSIRLGCFFLSYLIEDFDGYVETALAAYNAGRGNANKWLKDEEYSSDGKTLFHIPYTETRNYVKKVMDAYEVYGRLLEEA